jgi:hypothetical protein
MSRARKISKRWLVVWALLLLGCVAQGPVDEGGYYEERPCGMPPTS